MARALLVGSLLLAACAPSARDRNLPAIDLGELMCTARDGTANCRVIHGGEIACCGVQADGTDATWVCPRMPALAGHVATTPEEITGLVGAAEVEVGQRHVCARMLDGTVRCLGEDSGGALGRGVTSISEPVTALVVDELQQRAGLSPRVRLSGEQACEAMPDGAVYCGTNAELDRDRPSCTPASRGDSAGVRCNGWKPAGQCRQSPVALTVPGLTGVASLSQTCALLVDGTVQCWGRNHQGQLGVAASFPLPRPTQIAGLHDVVQVDGACALLASGRVRCWSDVRDPEVETLSDVDEIRIDEDDGCARVRGHVKCWGANVQGQLGLGVVDERPRDAGNGWRAPRRRATTVPGLDGATQLTAADRRRCALVDGAVFCWGEKYGPRPRRIDGIPRVRRIVGGGARACAIDEEQHVWCWGTLPPTTRGATARMDSPPERIDAFGRVVNLSSVGSMTCAVTEESRVRCWGWSFGEPTRVTGTPAAIATSLPWSDADLLPTRPTTTTEAQPSQRCERRTRSCLGPGMCFPDEDSCLDWRASAGRTDPCTMHTELDFVTATARCTCAWGTCTAGGWPCTPMDPETGSPSTDLAAACTRQLSSDVTAAPSAQRIRYCSKVTDTVVIACPCPVGGRCTCPTERRVTERCARSAAECEGLRQRVLGTPDVSADACKRVAP